MDLLTSSFRDPAGFVFKHENCVYRQVNKTYSTQFDRFVEGGLYDELVRKGYLVAHQDVTERGLPRTSSCHRILMPEQLSYISYPYEWSFSQLKDAAMLTLRVQTLALLHGLSLKDASAYNVQFQDGKPIFIDTLSFEPYEGGMAWSGYRQFCQHFLAPLALMSYLDADMSKLLMTHIDGIPLSLASTLLPKRSYLRYSLLAHIHLHAKMQSKYADQAAINGGQATSDKMTVSNPQAIVESLANAVRKLEWRPKNTEWGDYYEQTNYNDDAAVTKRKLVKEMLAGLGPLRVVHDLGANTGEFSRIAAEYAELVVSQDIDPIAVERNYLSLRKAAPRNLLPLRQDLFCPSPAIGWANDERESFVSRSSCDAILALALVHHLAISNNIPLEKVAQLFYRLCKWLIIEFVPKTDSQVERLLATRDDIFPQYSPEGFELAFDAYFSIKQKESVHGSHRTIYLLERRRQT